MSDRPVIRATDLTIAAAVGEGLRDSSMACTDQQQALKARLVQGAQTIEMLIEEVCVLRKFWSSANESTGERRSREQRL